MQEVKNIPEKSSQSPENYGDKKPYIQLTRVNSNVIELEIIDGFVSNNFVLEYSHEVFENDTAVYFYNRKSSENLNNYLVQQVTLNTAVYRKIKVVIQQNNNTISVSNLECAS